MSLTTTKNKKAEENKSKKDTAKNKKAKNKKAKNEELEFTDNSNKIISDIVNKNNQKIQENIYSDVFSEEIKRQALQQKRNRETQKAKEMLENKHLEYYKVKIEYQIPKFDEKKLLYIGKQDNEYQQIEVGDTVRYFNEKHPNHKKKGIVRKHIKSGGTFSTPRVEFEIIFNDPPFIKEYNPITNQKEKTKKKLK